MKRLSNTLMTLAITASLLIGTAVTSHSADSLSGSSDPTRNTYTGDFPYGFGPGDSSFCEATGKITSLHINKAGDTFFSIDHDADDDITRFTIMGSQNDFSHPVQTSIVTEAWIRHLSVKVGSHSQCTLSTDGSYSGGRVVMLSVLEEPTTN